ncbi:MAG: SusC/RagA family TonB-linked outer membrane protein, partial [Bacteroidota bacterium]
SVNYVQRLGRGRDRTDTTNPYNGAKLLETITPSFESALQGQAAGVNVIQGSGLAGSGSIVRIRGISSISATAEPLYVIDGVPIDVNYFLAEANWQNGAFNNNPLASLNPADIASVEILKDASAAGIYGSRGANGVVLITTKRAKTGKLSIDFSQRFATSDPVAKPQLLNGQEWLALRQEAWELDGNVGTVWIPNYSLATDPEAVRQEAFQAASQVDTDWWDLLTHTGLKSETNIGASVGNRFIKAYLGYTYGNSDSYIVGNNLQRHNARANFDFNFSKKLTVRLSSSYNYGINQRVRVSYTGGLGDAMSVALPIYKAYNDDGSYWRGFNSNTAPNPIFSNDNFEGYTVDQRALATVQAIYTPTDRFNIILNGGYDYFNQNNDQFDFLDFTNNPVQRAERDNRTVDNFNVSLVGEYSFIQTDNQNFKVLVGTEAQQKVTSGFNNRVFRGVESTEFVGQGDFTEENMDNTNLIFLDDDKESFLSFFTRLNYSLKDRYFFQVSARSDGSSKFGANNRFGFFPSASVGWIMSEEDFFNASAINFLKFKASYGILGNAGLPANQWIGTVNTNGQYNGSAIRYVSKIPNPDLKWETTNTFDIGMESGFFDDRVQVDLAYYSKRTTDALLQLTVPGYYGFGGSFWDNVAEISNTGVEATITAYPVKNSNFSWRTSLNGGYNTNEIVSIGDYTEDAVSGGTNDTRVVEGSPVGTNFLIRYGGVDVETGRPIYIDIDGNPTFEYNEARDRVPAGDVLPDLTGGWDNSIQFGNFSLNFLFIFSTGFDIYDSSSKRQLAFLSDWNVDRRIADRWKQPGDDTRYPKVTLDPAEHGNDKEWFNTDVWLNDGSYIRLRNLALNFNLPSNWVQKIKARSAQIGIGGTNLLTLTRYTGLDPEVARDFDNTNDRNLSPNITYLTPPQERSLSVSLSVKF